MIETKGRFAALLDSLILQDGWSPSRLEGVRFIRVSQPVPRSPVVYEPSIIFVGQGRKKGYLGEQVYTYDANNYLVLSVPLPFECETEASFDEPLLALSLRVDPTALGELLLEMEEELPRDEGIPRGIYSTPLTESLSNAVIRLLQCLQSPEETRIMGKSIVREILYRVLCGEQGRALRAVAIRHNYFSQIAKVLRRIHLDYSENLSVENMAQEANMSISTFHSNFKAVTSLSPLQYLKTIRLHKARLLMLHEGLNASTAADRVGYVSPSQFSREFKRFFGKSPLEESATMRGHLHES